MDTKLKKRIVGLALLLGAGLIIAPIFFSHSINSEQLQLSSRIPEPPAKPQPISNIKPSPAAPAGPHIVFEELQSVATKEDENKAISPLPQPPATSPSSSDEKTTTQLASIEKPTPILLTTATETDPKASIVPLSTMQPPAPAIKTGPNTANPVTATPEPSQAAAPVTSQNMTAPAPVSTASTTAAPVSSPAPTINDEDDQAPPPSLEEDTATVTTKAPAEKPLAKTNPAKAPKATKAKPVSAKAKPAVANKTRVATNATPTAQAWAVQLGSFSDKINAQKLMKTLQSQGYAAYTQTIKTAHGKTQTKVLVGPELRRQDAEKLQQKLKSVNATAMLIKVNS